MSLYYLSPESTYNIGQRVALFLRDNPNSHANRVATGLGLPINPVRSMLLAMEAVGGAERRSVTDVSLKGLPTDAWSLTATGLEKALTYL